MMLPRPGTRILLAVSAAALTAGTAACKPEPAAQPAPSTVGTVSPSARSSAGAVSPSARPAATTSATAGTASAASDATTATLFPGGLTSATFRTTLPVRPSLVSVRDMGPIHQNARVGGRDGGQSTRYGDKSVWVFNDTTLKGPWGFLSNSTAATIDLNAADGIDLRSSNGFTIDNRRAPVETVPRSAAEKAFEKSHAAPGEGCKGNADRYCGAIFGFWPGPVIADPVRHRVLFTYGKLCRGGQEGTPCSGPLGKGLGMGIAAIDMNDGTVTRLQASGGTVADSVEGADPTLFFPPGTDTVGSSAALVVDDYAYVYGPCDYFDCAVARVKLAQMTDRAAWRWYDGRRWVADARTAEKVGVQPGAAGNTVFYSPALKGYVDVYMPHASNEVWYRVGGSPFGPWSDGVKLMKTIGDTAHPNYALYGHSEFAEKNGLVQYLSYFNGKTGAQQLIRWEVKAGSAERPAVGR